MSTYIETAIAWFYSLSGTEIVALILAVLAITFVFSVAKAALKAGAAVVAFLAVLYLIEPELYSFCLALIQRVYESARAVF